MKPERRITLVARNGARSDSDWKYAGARDTAVAFVESVGVLRQTLVAASGECLDIGRIIADRTARAEEFLDLLTAFPTEFRGDALLIREDGTGVLSATARGGDRVLYALTQYDVRFYLETHDLVTGRIALGLTA